MRRTRPSTWWPLSRRNAGASSRRGPASNRDGEAERRENLNEEQRGRSLRSRGEKTLERIHPGLLCSSTRGVMSSRAHGDVSRVVAFLRVGPRDSATRESVFVAIMVIYVIHV